MTVEEYLKRNLPFFHVTPSKNIENILTNGLKSIYNEYYKIHFGICVVRSDDSDMWKYVAERYLTGEGDKDFTVIKIEPRYHFFKPNNIARDPADLPISNLYNYLKRKKLNISRTDICYTFSIADAEESKRINDKIESYLYEELEGYADNEI